jgi:hypothetical protein
MGFADAELAADFASEPLFLNMTSKRLGQNWITPVPGPRPKCRASSRPPRALTLRHVSLKNRKDVGAAAGTLAPGRAVSR